LLRAWRHFGLCLLLTSTVPLVTYEFFQKGSENLGIHEGLWTLSQRAEESVRWRTPTGWSAFDHALHEWQETGQFIVLAARSVRGQD
jgi:hypothetical protein